MRIAVMGSGGVGGYFGGLLARTGHEVGFVARGAHLAALRSNGLQVKSVHGDFEVAPVEATDQPSELGTVDLVLMTIKTPDVKQAAQAVKPIVREGTTVLSLLNGVEAPEQIGAVVGTMAMADKKLCAWVKNGSHKSDFKQYKDLLRQAKYVCRKCGRAAAKSKCLCKPSKL